MLKLWRSVLCDRLGNGNPGRVSYYYD